MLKYLTFGGHMKIVDSSKQQSMTPKEAQALLLALSATKLKVILNVDGGNYEITLDQLNALGLTLDSSGTIKRKTDADGLALVLNKTNKGELLVAGDVAIAATTVVYSSWFETKGYRFLFLTVTNPIAWSTNPASITVTQQFTDDNGTTKHLLLQGGGTSVDLDLNKEDATISCYFLTQMIHSEAIGTARFPNIDSDMKIRLVFTPTGTAESQAVGFEVYGVM